jgi:hypothetical protein
LRGATGRPRTDRIGDRVEVLGDRRSHARVHQRSAGVEEKRRVADSGTLGLGVDLDIVQPVGLDKQDALERLERRGSVAGSLRDHTKPVFAREGDGGHDVLGDGDNGDRVGTLIRDEVPRLARRVPPDVARLEQIPLEGRSELVEIGTGCVEVPSSAARSRRLSRP